MDRLILMASCKSSSSFDPVAPFCCWDNDMANAWCRAASSSCDADAGAPPTAPSAPEDAKPCWACARAADYMGRTNSTMCGTNGEEKLKSCFKQRTMAAEVTLGTAPVLLAGGIGPPTDLPGEATEVVARPAADEDTSPRREGGSD